MQRTIEPILKKWKEQSHRLPIILRGARQVGKSFIIEKFGRENFETLITCNFEFIHKQLQELDFRLRQSPGVKRS